MDTPDPIALALKSAKTVTFTRNTITFSSRVPRRKPKVGDIKVLKSGKRMVRVQRPCYGRQGFIGYETRRGRPLYDWVVEGTVTP